MNYRDYEREAAEHAEYLEREGIDRYEREGGAWQAKFERQQAEQQEQTWDGHHDRRLFDRAAAIADGELRDVDPDPLPWSAA